MQEETMAIRDLTAREYRNAKIFDLTKCALTGLLTANPHATPEEIADIADKAVLAAKLAAKRLIEERVI